MVAIYLFFFSNVSFALSQTTSSSEIGLNNPLKSSDRSPMQDLLAVPSAQSGHLLKSGQSQFEVQVDVANNFTSSFSGEESIRLDGERATVSLRWQQALGNKWQLGAELPWIYDGGGFFDSFIQDFHKFWDLPNAGREFTENNQLNYYYRSQSGYSSSVELKRSGSGIGDLRLQLARSLWRHSDRALSLHGQLKLPTGDSDYLRSSGSTDVTMGLSFADDKSGADYRISYYVNGGSIWLGDANVLDDKRRQFMAYGSVGTAWEILPALSVKLQLDAHSTGYNSQLRELNESVQLVIGGSVRINNSWLLDIGISEDLLVNSAQDVSVLLNLIYLHNKS